VAIYKIGTLQFYPPFCVLCILLAHIINALTEFSREESLLEDKAQLEEQFTERVKVLENELKTLKQVSKNRL
jgi:hypothetical protein